MLILVFHTEAFLDKGKSSHVVECGNDLKVEPDNRGI